MYLLELASGHPRLALSLIAVDSLPGRRCISIARSLGGQFSFREREARPGESGDPGYLVQRLLAELADEPFRYGSP